MPTSISSGVTRCSRVRIARLPAPRMVEVREYRCFMRDSPQRTIRLHRENWIQSTQARSIWTT